ncbi:MAG TPA: response regulator transcription factor [Candidatus Woesebacteria bacterium]|nr:response regulator transcription factor [Candidatus Woesebacteria bacterium]
MKILVVEDDHRIATSLKKGLELEHYTVDLAFDGIEGYDLASDAKYDLILLDLMLPGMDGLEICRKLRQETNHTPILMLTAKSSIEDKVTGLNDGADDYLAKPFAFEELLARIKALSRRPQQVINTVLKYQDLTVNLETFEVTRANKKIILSQKEFQLLETFIKHQEKVLSKNQLIDYIWSYDADILPNTVEVNIRNLRQKIDVPFKKPLIQTIRGFGYKLSVHV